MSGPGDRAQRRSAALRLGRRILAFAGVPFLSLLAPFVFLPVLARQADAHTWVAIALGQSIGSFAALVAGLGYATVAPPLVAAAGPEERRRMLATSLHARVPVWLASVVVASAVAAFLSPADRQRETVAMTVAMSLASLAPTWFWIGVGKALPILVAEVLPRMVATLAATFILLQGGTALWYPVLVAVSMVVGPAVIYVRQAGSAALLVSREELAGVARRHPPALIAEAAAGVYNALAVTIVSGSTSVLQAARYVSGDKAYRIGQYGVSALGNALQGWTAERAADVARRLRVTVVLHAGLGVAGLFGFGVAGAWMTRLLFGESVAIGSSAAWAFGVATLGISLGTAFGRIGLITLGARRDFMTCVVIASAVGAVSLAIGAAVWGLTGAAWALGLVELASAAAQAAVFAKRWRQRAAGALPMAR